MSNYDVDALRTAFPALRLLDKNGVPVAHFDTPSGTQVPQQVIDAVANWYAEGTANFGVMFAYGDRLVDQVREARETLAAFVNARSSDEIKFGNNTTTNAFHASRSITAGMVPGDELVVSELDHEANISPWILAAEDRGLVVRTVRINTDDCTLDLADLESKLSERTKLVAVGYASNAVGTINPIATITKMVHAVGALVWVDAVAYAPHGAIDVQALDVDFLTCSAYKFWGPHLGVLYAKAEALAGLKPYKVRPAHDPLETGAQNFEGIVGTTAAIKYLASLGDGSASDLRSRIVSAMDRVRSHEMRLFSHLIDRLQGMSSVRLYGITDQERFDQRTPTIALTIQGISPRDAAIALTERGIASTQGDFYATMLIDRLGLSDRGGVLRFGLGHYTTTDEIDRLASAVEEIAESVAVID